MTDTRSQDDLDNLWHMHTNRQIEASKGGILAVTVLNSGSWIALLTQLDKLAKVGGGDAAASILTAWGLGALLGTLPWLFIYINTQLLWRHDCDRDKRTYQIGITATIWLGLLSVLGSLCCFGWGLYLSQAALRAAQN